MLVGENMSNNFSLFAISFIAFDIDVGSFMHLSTDFRTFIIPIHVGFDANLTICF